MNSDYKNFIRENTKSIDNKIATAINNVSDDICEKLKGENVNIIDTNGLIEKIKEKNNFIQDMFKSNFSENEEMIIKKVKKKTPKEKDAVDWVSNRILEKKINEVLDGMLEKTKNPQEIATILDRKIFLNILFKTGEKEKRKNQTGNER